jgi:hypothetical protein
VLKRSEPAPVASVLVVATSPPREGEVFARALDEAGKPGVEVARARIGSADPAKLSTLKAGSYLIELQVEGVPTLERKVSLKPGEPEVLIFPLPAQQVRAASVRLEVEPKGATVLLDGAQIDADRQVPVTPGRHELRVAFPGYSEHRETIEVVAGAQMVHPVTLQQVKGILDVATEPSGAEIFVNGQSVGTSPFVLDNLEYGKAIKLKLKLGDLLQVRTVTLRREEPRRALFVVLSSKGLVPVEKPSQEGLSAPDPQVPQPPPARSGSEANVGYLIANTQPWARVLIDGKDTGRSTPIPPISKISLSEGKHIVTFVVGNGNTKREFEYQVTIKAGKDHRLIKTLEGP